MEGRQPEEVPQKEKPSKLHGFGCPGVNGSWAQSLKALRCHGRLWLEAEESEHWQKRCL